MEETPQYQMPPTDTSPFSLMLAMLTFFTLVMYGALGREVAPVNTTESE